jgi:hypothetical protein
MADTLRANLKDAIDAIKVLFERGQVVELRAPMDKSARSTTNKAARWRK